MLGNKQAAAPLIPFSRKEFYTLAAFCEGYAQELARFDQARVNLKECHRFNDWLAQLKRYERLGPQLRTMRPARPVSRWQLMALLAVLWGVLLLVLPGRVDRTLSMVLLGSVTFTAISFLFLPEWLYGTTIELLEAKVLRVVDTLLELLNSGEMEFTEAAFFKAREHLLAARTELRQQIDLAHR